MDKIENAKLYAIPTFNPPNNTILNHTKEHLHTITNDVPKLQSIHNEIAHPSIYVKNILTYELLNYKPPNNDIITTNQTSDLIIKLLQRYQNIVGGFNIEDTQWTKHVIGSTRFAIRDENTIILSNTTTKEHLYSPDITTFVQNIVKHASNYVNGPTITYKILDDYKNEIYWICIIIKQ